MFQRMTIWDCPLSAALFHSQSWWCASFHHSITFTRVSSSIASHVSKDDDMKVSFRYIFMSPLMTRFTRAWTILEWHCPQYDLNVLVHWLSFFEHYCLQFTDSSFNHFSLPHSWSEYNLFFLLRVHCIAPSCSTFQRVSMSVNVISIKDFAYPIDVLLCLIIFLVLESTLIFQRSCLFKV